MALEGLNGSIAIVLPDDLSKVRILLESTISAMGFPVLSFQDFPSMAVAVAERGIAALLFSLEHTDPEEIKSVLQVLKNIPGGDRCKILGLHDQWDKMKIRLMGRSMGCSDVLPTTPTEVQLRQVFGLPTDNLQQPTAQAEPQPQPPETSKSVLVVDDASIIRNGLKHILLEMGLSVMEASNGNEAYNIFLSSTPDLLITDLIMPGMDGFALMSRFRGNPSTAKKPIIVVSSYGDKPRLVKALRSGANDFIVKPFRPEVVKDKVKRHLSI
ncbi:MAG: response regulator [Thermanaerothrix sp.]|nr:response regulator [Thermanaerothrix sp.]